MAKKKITKTEMAKTFKEKISNNQEKIKQVELIASYLLNHGGITTPEKAISGSNIFEKYQNQPKKWNLPVLKKSTFEIYLSRVANLSDSLINTPGRKQGYYIIDEMLREVEEELVIEPVATKQEEGEKKNNGGNLMEKDLYPFLKQWLLAVGNERADDISVLRPQGKWANPDLVGFKSDDLFGSLEVEITTIEAKITVDLWEQWVFEAVAHTVFANRAYFAFVHAEELLNKIDSELKHYAEIFGVGILVLTVSYDNFKKIKKREAFELSDENHKIIEYSPAPFKTPHIKFKKKFLNGIGIMESKQIHTFGDGVE